MAPFDPVRTPVRGVRGPAARASASFGPVRLPAQSEASTPLRANCEKVGFGQASAYPQNWVRDGPAADHVGRR